jgi:Kef-type K+ transport system membrane component KefB
VTEHEILVLTVQLVVLLVLARVGGEVAARLGQPAVIGQLLAGVLLGKSFFGAWLPEARDWLFPAATGHGQPVQVVTWLGVLLLLFLVGLETDLALIRQQGRPALCIAVTGFLLPALLGIGVALTVPDELLANPNRILFALFVGAALSESSVPVVARILADLRLLRRNVGQTILATALLQDTVGWIALAAIAATASSGRLDAMGVIKPLVGVLALTLFVLTIGRRAAFALLRWLNDRARGEHTLLAGVLIIVFCGAAVAELAGIHSILGAFLAGLMIAGSPVLGEKVIHPVEGLTTSFLAPVFFAAAGLNVDLSGLAGAEGARTAALLLLAACAGKIAGGYAGGRWGGLTAWEALSVGLGINARGALGIVIAVLGLNLGVLSVPLFSALILTALVTTAMTPPLLTGALARVELRPEEQARLEREAAEAGSFVGRLRRVLLPTTGGEDTVLTAKLLQALGSDRPLEVTALHVATPRSGEPGPALAPVIAALKGGKVTVVPRTSSAPQTAIGIKRESERGYDLVALGCGQAAASLDAVFGRAADQVAPEVDCPLLMVRAPEGTGDERRLRRILVPTTGLLKSTHAAELAVAWARAAGGRVTALHVIEAGEQMSSWLGTRERETEQLARELASWVAALARPYGVEVETMIRSATDAAPAIVEAAGNIGADLIVLSGELRPTHRLFLGHTIEYVLRHGTCAVAVIRL